MFTPTWMGVCSLIPWSCLINFKVRLLPSFRRVGPFNYKSQRATWIWLRVGIITVKLSSTFHIHLDIFISVQCTGVILFFSFLFHLDMEIAKRTGQYLNFFKANHFFFVARGLTVDWKSYMTCLGHYAIKPPYIREACRENKCAHTNDMLESGRMYLY